MQKHGEDLVGDGGNQLYYCDKGTGGILVVTNLTAHKQAALVSLYGIQLFTFPDV